MSNKSATISLTTIVIAYSYYINIQITNIHDHRLRESKKAKEKRIHIHTLEHPMKRRTYQWKKESNDLNMWKHNEPPSCSKE